MATQAGTRIGLSISANRIGIAAYCRLWHVPAFFVGLVLLAAVCLAHSFWTRPLDPQHQLVRELLTARRLLGEPEPDLEKVRELSGHTLDAAANEPKLLGMAHFLLGSAYLREAHRAAAADALFLGGKARFHLEQADALGVPEEDALKLSYRLANVWFK